MSKWNRMDKASWNNSEVMTEFEKIIIRAMNDLNKIIEDGKIVMAQDAQQVSQKLKQINTEVDTASKSMNSFLDKAKNLADDPQSLSELENDEPEVMTEEMEKAAQAEARAALLEELNQLSITAANNGDFKLAYKIERTIDSVLYDEE